MPAPYVEGEPVKTKGQEVAWAMLFALETAMRLGEITAMTWKNVHIDKMYVHLPDTKNGLTRNIPLSERAEELLRHMQGVNSPRVLSIDSDSLSLYSGDTGINVIFRTCDSMTCDMKPLLAWPRLIPKPQPI